MQSMHLENEKRPRSSLNFMAKCSYSCRPYQMGEGRMEMQTYGISEEQGEEFSGKSSFGCFYRVSKENFHSREENLIVSEKLFKSFFRSTESRAEISVKNYLHWQ